MKRITSHTIVELSYELRDGDASGTLLERMDAKYPLKFYFGSGKLLPALEDKLDGLREGETFSLTVPPEGAYGLLDPSLIVEMTLDSFDNHPWINRENLSIGDRISIDQPDGSGPKYGLITEVLPESILVDFNHAMAGKTLHFKGTVLHIRPPSQEERARKHYIESSGAHFD
ncbi:MAG: FKBP-type peptidyl-prolyl cis-trans isomerase [Flavobacteriia bacterium]|nr:FKBP-type peptidyl-prolyl cis-trans isomerase [Flavobacteriia bacterium]